MTINAVISIPMNEPIKNTTGNHQIETIGDLRFHRADACMSAGYRV